MKKIVICVILIFIANIAIAQIDSLNESSDSLSAFSGARFYSRTLKSDDKQESVQQWVLPIFVGGLVTDSFRVRIYQTLSNTQIKDSQSYNSVENTNLRFSFKILENLATYAGLSIPIYSHKPDAETAHINNILYNEILQFGVNKTNDGFNTDIGIGLTLPLGKTQFGLGAGYMRRGEYDVSLLKGGSTEYKPGDTLSATLGVGRRIGLAILQGNILYLRYGYDTISGEESLKNGDEISFVALTKLRLKTATISVFLDDTLKNDNQSKQENVVPESIFRNRTRFGTSLSYIVSRELLIIKARAVVKSLFDKDWNVNEDAFSFDAGGTLIISDNLNMDLIGNLIFGVMDNNKTDVSGFSIGLTVNYEF
jgi:hypothetical protein